MNPSDFFNEINLARQSPRNDGENGSRLTHRVRRRFGYTTKRLQDSN